MDSAKTHELQVLLNNNFSNRNGMPRSTMYSVQCTHYLNFQLLRHVGIAGMTNWPCIALYWFDKAVDAAYFG